MTSRAVFLDRDNTLVFDPGYLSNPADVQLLDRVVEGLALLTQAGFALVIVTNQAGVARGYFDESAVSAVNAEIVRQLSAAGVLINAVYYCPYHPEGIIEPFNQNHPDRKPNPGMLLRASRDFGFDLVQSWMIGDSMYDSEAGKRAGCRTIRIRSANTKLRDDDSWTDYFCGNMLEAADIIIGEL
jgi:D-glycero-D-manno-heptose 1,7-bisphosphate phosphatase